MIQKVSKIINMRIKEFMNRILQEEAHRHNRNHRHEDVRESSMLFKEMNFAMKSWTVEIPTSGFSGLFPRFDYDMKMIQQPWERLDKAPKPNDIFKFISVIMNAFSVSSEVCLISLIFIERLLKVGKV